MIQFITHYDPIHYPLSFNPLLTNIQFITHYDPIHYPLSSNPLLTNNQFITHYDPIHCPWSQSPNNLTPYRHRFQLPTASPNKSRNKTNKCAVFLTPRDALQLRMTSLTRTIGTARARRNELVFTAVCGCVYLARVSGQPERWKWA
jgi:hypothetical protein